jgi:hypothetical protein
MKYGKYCQRIEPTESQSATFPADSRKQQGRGGRSLVRNQERPDVLGAILKPLALRTTK